jgi:hypothetical protein
MGLLSVVSVQVTYKTTSFSAIGSTGPASFKDYGLKAILKTIWDTYEDKEIKLHAKRQNRKMTWGMWEVKNIVKQQLKMDLKFKY